MTDFTFNTTDNTNGSNDDKRFDFSSAINSTLDLSVPNGSGAPCPHCGHINKKLTTPKLSTSPEVIGNCDECGHKIIAHGTNQQASSRYEQIEAGHENEEEISDRLCEKYDGLDSHEDRGTFNDIDRTFYDSDDNPTLHLEIKTRSCSLNGYRKTKFPHTKIETGKELLEEGVDVGVLIVFTDGIAVLPIKQEKDYTYGNEQFDSNKLDTSSRSDKQIPVEIPVDELRVLTNV